MDQPKERQNGAGKGEGCRLLELTFNGEHGDDDQNEIDGLGRLLGSLRGPCGPEVLTQGTCLRASEHPSRVRVRPYSTVTDFARLRGWSASLPMITAVWYASIWIGAA